MLSDPDEAVAACCLCGRLVTSEEKATLTIEESSVQRWAAHRNCVEADLFSAARHFLAWDEDAA